MEFTTKQKMVAGAADLISRRGACATTLRDVVQHTGTPRGSLMHHFPGGKQQMLEEAVRYAAEAVALPLADALKELGPQEGLGKFIAWWRRILEASEFQAGCPVLAVAVESGGEADGHSGVDEALARDAAAPREQLRSLVQAAFERWQAILADSLAGAGVERGRAARLATLVVASIEGTVAMCRASRSSAPLEDVAEELRVALAQAISRQPA